MVTENEKRVVDGGRPLLLFHGSKDSWPADRVFNESTGQLFLTPDEETAKAWAGRGTKKKGKVSAFYVLSRRVANLDAEPERELAFNAFIEDLSNDGVDTTGYREAYMGMGSGETWEFLETPQVRNTLLANGYDSACFDEIECFTYAVFSKAQLWPATRGGNLQATFRSARSNR